MTDDLLTKWHELSAVVFTETNVWIVSSSSLFMFVASLILIPWFISRLPADYFTKKRHSLRDRIHESTYAKAALLIAKNLLGLLLLAAGILMLALPGQGLLTILVGIILMDFPGKQDVECRILKTKGVKSSADWLRKKYKKEPFVLR